MQDEEQVSKKSRRRPKHAEDGLITFRFCPTSPYGCEISAQAGRLVIRDYAIVRNAEHNENDLVLTFAFEDIEFEVIKS